MAQEIVPKALGTLMPITPPRRCNRHLKMKSGPEYGIIKQVEWSEMTFFYKYD
jgi:hypothetical protein